MSSYDEVAYTRKIAAYVEQRFEWKLKKYPATYSELDYMAISAGGRIVGAVEIKTRDLRVTDYDTAVVDLIKWESAVRFERLYAETEAWIVYAWARTNTLARIRPSLTSGLALGGLEPPGKPWRPVVYVPVTAWEFLENPPGTRAAS